MATWREILETEGYEKLSEARNLSDILSKDDPDDDPYRSLYKARENYKEVRKALKKFADRKNTDEEFVYVWAALESRYGDNYIRTEETSTGEEHIQKCLEKMEDYKLSPKGFGIYHDALNQMGILWTKRNKPEEALEYLKQAELLYVDYKNDVGGAPFMIDEFLSPPKDDDEKLQFERSTQLESCYTHTLFYFAQVYQNLGDKEISAQYVHKTLERQLGASDFDGLDWSLHAATLSQYYMTDRNFTMSRHCLASSEVVFEQAVANMENMDEEMREKVNQAKADIQRCWIKYGLGLLEHSKDKLTLEATGQSDENTTENVESKSENAEPNHVDQTKSDSKSEKEVTIEKVESPTNSENDSTHNEDIEGPGNQESVSPTKSENEIESCQNVEEAEKANKEEKKLEHERFNLETTSHEESITDQPLKSFDEAKDIFLLVKKWIENAKEFYKFDYHCNDYVSIVQDHSLSFKFLSFFELDMQRQCQMHKRRIDMLSEILKELNPQHYLLICRQLMFEIADTYSNMMDLKLAILESATNSRLTPHNVKKINTLVKESIQHYQDYLNTLKGDKPVYPDEFPPNDIRPGLIAMFCMGRLYSKYMVVEVQARLLNIKKSKDCYQFVVDYCKRNSSAVQLVATELDICQEMVQLLPRKMEKIRRESEM